MKDVFISYSGLSIKLHKGTINPKELDGALFYFGCAREAIKRGPQLLNERYDIPMNSAREIHDTIVGALMNAEKKGRVQLRTLNGHSSYSGLNALLEQNGIDTSTVAHMSQEDSNYCYPGVVREYKHLIRARW